MARNLFAFALACVLLSAAPLLAAPPNIVLILADDLGINDLACYGRKDHTTPRLDQMAREGIRFTCAYCAQPICSASRASLMTGKHPAALHLTTFLPGRPDAPSQKLLHPKIEQQLPLEEVTIAERLKKAGYVTGCFGKWHLGGEKFGPKEQGFDEYFAGKANTKPGENEGGKGEFELTSRALEFIETNKEKSFFCYIPHNSPHIPFTAKPELIEKHKNAFNPTYAAVIESLDECVGRVLDKLAELKLDEQTIVVFSSDNGGLHILEGNNTPATHNTPFRAGKGFLYEGGLRVPLIVRWPKAIKPAVVNDPVSLLDLPFTFAAAAGGEAIAGKEGVDLLPCLRGEKTFTEVAKAPTFFWHFPHYTNQGSRPASAIRVGNLKVIFDYESEQAEVYDLEQDASEQRNLFRTHQQIVEARKVQMRTTLDLMKAQTNEPNPVYNADLAKACYRDIDVSNLKPAATAAELAEKLKPWRAAMDAAIRPRPAANPKAAP